MWCGAMCVCGCGDDVEWGVRRMERRMVVGPLCMCTGWWGVWGRGGDAYVMCVLRGLTMVWRGREGEHGHGRMW